MKRIYLIFFIGIFFTMPFWFLNTDIYIQKFFYDVSTGWKYENKLWVLFFYNIGIYPALILGIVSIILLGLGGFYKILLKFRKPLIVILLTLILGPGLLINVIGKNFSGRPRPRDIVEFGGDWKYRKVFELGVPGKGHSFPCGHASMGFVFYALYVVLRDKKKLWSCLWLLFSLFFGFSIGISRMVQGAHFLSDVIWSGVFTFISAEFVFLVSAYVEKYFANIQNIKNRLFEYLITPVLIILLVFIFLIATPFYVEKKYEFNDLKNKLYFSINVDEGDIKFKSSDNKFKILLNANGFAAPKRKYYEKVEVKNENEYSNFNVKIIKKGLFSELNSILNFEIPGLNQQIFANLKKGSIKYEAKGILDNCVFYTAKGDIIFSPESDSEIKNIFLKTQKGDIIIFLNENIKIKGPADFFIQSKKGKVFIYNKSNFLSDFLNEKERIKGAKEIIYKSKEANGINMNIISDGIYVK